MDNLARIISHGFAVVVVVLLGIGFIYRGELFPDLELPDFLVPESAKTAGTGAHPETIQPETSAIRETTPGEAVEGVPSAPAPAAEQTIGMTAPEPGVAAEGPEAPPAREVISEGSGVKAMPPEAEQTARVTESAVEPLQAAAEESQPPVVEEPAPTGGAPAEETEASGGAIQRSVTPPAPSGETPAELPVEMPVPETGAQAGSVSQEPPPQPGILPEMAPQGGAPSFGAGEQPAPSEALPEATAPGTGASLSESAPVTAPARQPAAGGAGHAAGESAAEGKPYELLAAAREAFWLHNYDDAEKNYRALTELEPNNPDGYGELGNMYFSQGRWDEAAAAYYEAGIRLVSEGRLDSARELVNVIRGLNGTQADDLDKLIRSAASTGNN